jgi:hypothetical protein
MNFNQTEFIRQRPNMTPQQIVEEAARLGQTIRVNFVWTVRSKDRKDRKAAQGTQESNETTFNKSEFIRQRPNLSASEISTQAEALGQEIPPQMVWSIRSADKKKSTEASPAPAKSKPKKVAKKRVAKPVQVVAKPRVAAKPMVKKATKKVAKKATKKVAKKAATKVAKKAATKPIVHKPEVVRAVPRVTATQVTNGHKVTVVVFDPRDAKGVKAANRAIREAVSHA